MNLDEFVASNAHNEWIKEPGLSYYVKKSVFFPGLILLSNCHVENDGVLFGYYRFLKRYEHRLPFFAEQVLNSALAMLYRRRHWREYDIGGIPQFLSPLAVETFETHERFARLYG